jgi:hypothetical protein
MELPLAGRGAGRAADSRRHRGARAARSQSHFHLAARCHRGARGRPKGAFGDQTKGAARAPRPGSRSSTISSGAACGGPSSSSSMAARGSRKPATGSSPSPACRQASGAARAPPTRSNGYTRSSSAGSKRRLCCRRRTRPPCCSGRYLPPARPTCAKSMVGEPSPQNPLISHLISPQRSGRDQISSRDTDNSLLPKTPLALLKSPHRPQEIDLPERWPIDICKVELAKCTLPK